MANELIDPVDVSQAVSIWLMLWRIARKAGPLAAARSGSAIELVASALSAVALVRESWAKSSLSPPFFGIEIDGAFKSICSVPFGQSRSFLDGFV